MIPHSSDFYLRGPYADDFLQIHSSSSLDRKQFVQCKKSVIEKGSTNLIALDYLHTLNYVYEASTISSLLNPETSYEKGSLQIEADKLDIPLPKTMKLERSFIEKCYAAFLDRAKKRDLDLNSKIAYLFGITEKKIVYKLDIWSGNIHKFNGTLKNISSIQEACTWNDQYVIGLEANERIMLAILENKIHISNALIGCYLTTFRNSNEFNNSAYHMLNFIHL